MPGQLFRILVCWFSAAVVAFGSELKPDETVVFFPTVGQRVKDGWELEIHGVVYELSNHKAMAALLRKALRIREAELDAAEKATFAERARFFFVDNERSKTISIRLGERTEKLSASAPNGHFKNRIHFTSEEMDRLKPNAQLSHDSITFQTESKTKMAVFSGTIRLLDDHGLSVISDIDDTIKVSEVRNRKALIRNTFCRPFQPVPGMAQLYSQWAQKSGAEFHYVSASPWQLYVPLSEFVRTNQFPVGSFGLKLFRVKDGTFFDLFASPEKYKMSVIEPLLARFPERRFVLVGDSGEKDPEIYGALARKHPSQIVRIFIRDVTGEPAVGPRYQKAFTGIPNGVWKVFKEPAEIAASLP